MGIEASFDASFVARLTSEEKQIQQNYRPVIGVHKWFARRPGSLFRSLLLSEFALGDLRDTYFKGQSFENITIGDPFMGGGTSLFEANRIGCNVLGFDINPMAWWIVRQELVRLDRVAFAEEARKVIDDVERQVSKFYVTRCTECEELTNVKYYLWVKTQECGGCSKPVDLFPGYLVAENSRHTHFVLHCPHCTELVQLEEIPSRNEKADVACPACAKKFAWNEGSARKGRYLCGSCGHEGRYSNGDAREEPPKHRLFGIEYHCERCRPGRRGRFFKTADQVDQKCFNRAKRKLERTRAELDLPTEEIPDGDETRRLLRWGYSRYSEMFNERQLLSLGLLLQRIKRVTNTEVRHALATVFSDFLRYQNMLCRYDTFALKCQDIFAVHGFPVGLVQCENNVLGIPRVGSGAFRHFVEKYDRAKAYCEAPFETLKKGRGKVRLEVAGERIDARLTRGARTRQGTRNADLRAGSFDNARVQAASLDGVFTDPPYFDNVQYAELMDFCFVWLRKLLVAEVQEFQRNSTRCMEELTGNVTTGKGLEHFTEGLSSVFSSAARAIKPGGPFAFTYHHNDVEAYTPVVVAVLDSGMVCTGALPAPAEMGASLHINGTGSSIVDTVMVCRHVEQARPQAKTRLTPSSLRALLRADKEQLEKGGVKCTRGDIQCLAMGHLARLATLQLHKGWDRTATTAERMRRAEQLLRKLSEASESVVTAEEVAKEPPSQPQDLLPFGELSEARVLDRFRGFWTSGQKRSGWADRF